MISQIKKDSSRLDEKLISHFIIDTEKLKPKSSSGILGIAG
jgi:hypothetical protein